MKIRRLLAQTYLRFSRWNVQTEPLPDHVIVIGAPHTSNWDGVFMALSFWSIGRPFSFLVKDSVTKAPVLGAFVKAIGGIGIDRTAAGGIVQQIVDQVAEARREGRTFTLAMTPKGTRSQREYWKSGFYRMARQANVPLQLGFVDSTTHTFGWAGILELTGDVKADMDTIRSFYANKVGIRPELTSTPRLRMEEAEHHTQNTMLSTQKD